MTGLLRRVMESRALLTVTLPASDEPHNSALLAVRPEDGYLELDELKPRPDRLARTDNLRVATFINGVEINFPTQIVAVDMSSGAALYRVKFPAAINYFQRRAHYRARVGHARPLPVTITTGGGRRIEGRLRDISIGGIGFALRDLPAPLAENAVIACAIALPDGEYIECQATICSVNRSVTDSSLIVGARFVRLDGAEQGMVARFVALLDREAIKKRRNAK